MMNRRRNCMDPICVKCGGPNDRVPQAYCHECHRTTQAQWRRGMVSIPVDMVTQEQKAWLDRQRPGRRRTVPRERIHERETA